MFGQAAGGILGDWFGWRGVFFVLAGILAVAAIGLWRELLTNPLTRTRRRTNLTATARLHRKQPRGARQSVGAHGHHPGASSNTAFMFGAFAYIGADLRQRFDLNYSVIGLIIGTFGAGGLIYASLVKQFVARFGQIGLARPEAAS